MIDALLDGARGGDWPLLVASAITVLVWLGRRVGLRYVDARHAALVAAGLGTLAAVGATVAQDAPATLADWTRALLRGVEHGAAASGLWSLAAKRVLPIREYTP